LLRFREQLGKITAPPDYDTFPNCLQQPFLAELLPPARS